MVLSESLKSSAASQLGDGRSHGDVFPLVEGTSLKFRVSLFHRHRRPEFPARLENRKTPRLDV